MWKIVLSLSDIPLVTIGLTLCSVTHEATRTKVSSVFSL